jgi:hypothetical protein
LYNSRPLTQELSQQQHSSESEGDDGDDDDESEEEQTGKTVALKSITRKSNKAVQNKLATKSRRIKKKSYFAILYC